MAQELKIPPFGESITTANVSRWQKAEGDFVKKGEALVTLETDKVSQDLEAPCDGILQIKVGEDEEVEVGALIAMIDDSAAAPSGESAPAAAPASSAESSTPAASTGEVREVKIPPFGDSITSASLAAWKVSNGDTVQKGEVLITLETDKVSQDLEADVSGTVELLVEEGEEVPIGTVIARLTEGAGSASASTPAASPAPAQPAASPAPVSAAATESPRVKPDLSVLTESKPATELAPVSNDGRVTRKKMSMLRRKIAQHLVNAQQTAAILTTFNEVDMSGVMALRKEVQEEFVAKHGVKLGFMSLFTKAVVLALKENPGIRSFIEGNEIVAGKAKDGTLQIEDLQGGIFTISNGGVYGSLLSTPILNPPQSGILGMHTIQQRPIAVDGKVEIRPMMYLALSYDHRIVDGKEGVTFLIKIKELLENPARLLLEC